MIIACDFDHSKMAACTLPHLTIEFNEEDIPTCPESDELPLEIPVLVRQNGYVCTPSSQYMTPFGCQYETSKTSSPAVIRGISDADIKDEEIDELAEQVEKIQISEEAKQLLEKIELSKVLYEKEKFMQDALKSLGLDPNDYGY